MLVATAGCRLGTLPLSRLGAGGRLGGRVCAAAIERARLDTHRNTLYTGEIVALPCDGSPDCRRATLHRSGTGQTEPPMMAFDSQGIALILIVAVLSLVVGGAALWIELP